MKRDLNLIMKLLLRIEEFPPSIDDNYNYKIDCNGYDKQTINYHLYLMKQEKLIEGVIYRSIINKKISVHYETLELTNKGHDFRNSKMKVKVWGNE